MWCVDSEGREKEGERALSVPRTCSPIIEELAARQLVFIDDWVRPLYKVSAILFPGAKSRLPEIERNREQCKKLIGT